MNTWMHPTLILLVTASLFIAGCKGDRGAGVDIDTTAIDTTHEMTGMRGMHDSVAVAQLEPTEGNNVRGTVTFTPESGGVRVVANITGLSAGRHGFHVHETGDCSAADASSAGGHFAPEGSPHGGPDDPRNERHIGDLGNITADASGVGTYDRVDSLLTLSGAHSIVGRAVIVHEDEDDLTSQPSGDAGGRMACGVVEMQMGGMPGGMAHPGMMGDTTGMGR
jgi:superoxide dismutase, Cu-Zn family